MPMQSQHFSSPQIWSGSHFLNSRNTFAAVYTDILHLCHSMFTQKVVPSLLRKWFDRDSLWHVEALKSLRNQATGFLVLRHLPLRNLSLQQGTYVLDCGPILQVNSSVHEKSGSRWSRSAGSRSPQRLLCAMTTEIVNSSFYCGCVHVFKLCIDNIQWLFAEYGYYKNTVSPTK